MQGSVTRRLYVLSYDSSSKCEVLRSCLTYAAIDEEAASVKIIQVLPENRCSETVADVNSLICLVDEIWAAGVARSAIVPLKVAELPHAALRED